MVVVCGCGELKDNRLLLLSVRGVPRIVVDRGNMLPGSSVHLFSCLFKLGSGELIVLWIYHRHLAKRRASTEEERKEKNR